MTNYGIAALKLFSPHRGGRRDVLSYSLPLILPKYRRTERTAKNKRVLFLKIIKPLRSLRLCGDYLTRSRIASKVPLAAAYPAAIVAALLAGKTVFTRLFFGDPVGFLGDKYFAL